MEQTSNRIVLRGNLAEPPEFSHENHGRRFFRFALEVPRLSGTADTLQVMAAEPLLEAVEAAEAPLVEVTGQIRSFNSRSETGRKLIISVYAETLALADGEPVNHVELEGTLCKAPIYRRTPLGREICDVMLAVNRPYRRTDYLPCILWGRSAREAARLAVGDRLALTGRLQSREYVKILDGVGQKRVAYEVSAVSAAPAAAAL